MNLNQIVDAELRYIPSHKGEYDTRGFRQVYQRERLKSLKANPNEPVWNTILHVSNATKLAIGIDPLILQNDFIKIIEPLLKPDTVMETREEDLNSWTDLPSGKPILLLRKANDSIHSDELGKRDFLPWPNKRSCKKLVITSHFNTGLFDMYFVSPNNWDDRTNTNMAIAAHKYEATIYHSVMHFDANGRKWSLEEELGFWDNFIKDLKTVVENY